MPNLRRLLLWISILSVGCAGAPPTGGSPSPSKPSPAAPLVSPSPTMGTEKGLRALEEAIRRGDWAAALEAYEAAGGPPLPADLLNRAMAQGIYLALQAREAEKDPEADQHIRGALALVRRGCHCLDPQGRPIPGRIPEGFHDELYFYLALADAKTIHWWEREKAVIQDPLLDEVVRRMAQRAHITEEDVRLIPIAECPMTGHYFLVVGFQIFDLLGTFRGTAPGLDQLHERERNPSSFKDLSCEDQRISWMSLSAGGRGILLEAEWDGQGFRPMRVTRMDVAGETYQKVRRFIEAGDLESAYDAYTNGFTNDIDTDPEITTLALRKGLEVARRRAAAGDVEGALRALHNAFLLASFYYRLDRGTFLPEGWEQRPRTLEEWKQEAFGVDPLLYREALTEYAALMLMWRDRRPDLVQLALVEQILRGLIVLSPDYAPPYLYLGDALWEQGKHEEARRFYQQYRERAPDAPLPERVRERLP